MLTKNNTSIKALSLLVPERGPTGTCNPFDELSNIQKHSPEQDTGCVKRKGVMVGIKTTSRGFPGGAVVENLPANTGDTGSSPGLGGSHMPRSNSAREPQLLSLRVWSLCSATREATTVRGPRTVMKSGPCSPQLALAQK